MQHRRTRKNSDKKNILVGVFKLRANSHDASISNSRFLYSRNGEEKGEEEVCRLVDAKSKNRQLMQRKLSR
jgi:hypothetical protein